MIIFFPVFLLLLCWQIFIFILKIVWNKYSIQIVNTFIFIIFLSYWSIFLTHMISITESSQLLKINYLNKTKFENLLKTQEKEWNKIYLIQPTHRDVLINLEKISCSLEKPDCQFFKDKINLIDPNFIL